MVKPRTMGRKRSGSHSETCLSKEEDEEEEEEEEEDELLDDSLLESVERIKMNSFS